MWTPRLQYPRSSRESEMASSKSRAVAGSIVTVRTSRRSSRSLTSSSLNCLGLLAGLFEHVVVEDVGDVERADDGEGVDAGLTAGAEDLGDHPFAFQDTGVG